MEKIIAAFTIFTFLLFTVSTALIALNPIGLRGSDVVYKSSTVADSEGVAKPESELDDTTANDRFPRLIFSRSYPIQRHFPRTTRIPLRFVRRHPCRKFKKTFMIPTRRSYGNDMILSDKSTSVDLETLGDQIPTKWLELKHKYGHRHHHEKFEMKKREHKGGFMRRIRKFLKQTFGYV